tara:strand:- start:974 stop:1708 length:735 start_codon:yes stop_codon:yes gene_type:complete
MIHLVTFATGHCINGQKKMVQSAIKQGFHPDNIHTFSHDDVFNDPFVKENMHIFGERKGVGYWAWKPLLILKAMKQIQMGDVIVYHDSGRPCYDFMEFTEPLTPFVDHVCKHFQGVGIVFGPFKHQVWTKRDCFELMGCTDQRFKTQNQASATWGIWEKSILSITILSEWLRWMMHDSRIVTDDKSILGEESKNFRHHRHDQSILTNILLRLHFQGKYRKLMRSQGVYEKNINKIAKRVIERQR